MPLPRLALPVAVVLALASGAAAAQAYPPWLIDPKTPFVPPLDTFNVLRKMNYTTIAITTDGQVIMGPAVRCAPPVPPKQTVPPDLNPQAMEVLQQYGVDGGTLPPFPPIAMAEHCYPYPTKR